MFRHSRRSLQALRRPFIASTSKRSIISWVSDVVQARSLFPPNPILDSLERSLQQRGDGLTSDNIVTPQLSRARPHHVQQAAVQIQEQYLSDLQEIETKAKSIVSIGPSIRPADASAALQEIVLSLNRIQAKGRSVQQTASLLWLNSDLEKKTQWKKAASEVTSTLEFAHEESQSIHNALRLLLDSVEKSSSENEPDSTDQDVLWAAKFLIRTYKHRVGDGLDSEKKQQFSDISLALEEVEAGLQFSSGRSSQQRVGDFYNYVGLRTEQAKMLGYRNVAEMVMEPRMASLEKVKNLHESISERVLPLLDAERKASKSKDELALDAYLSPQSDTGNSNTIDPRRLDEFERIRLEQHVTLDGTLAFIARLSKDILGVSFVEETENVHGWHRDVRLFHVYDELDSSTYIGSFFLDPFERIGKLERASTTPIYVRGLDSKPVVSVSLNIVAPMWDNLPVPMTWDDIANSLHEIAHVYQFMLARPTLGGIVGPHNMPFDLSEFLPKFFEHFLMEKSTLYALIDLSQSELGLSDESIDAAYRVRSRLKAFELAQLCFYGSLELSLFSEFDLRSSESMLALQNRTAEAFIPHDLPDPKDLSPLLEIMQENANGRHVGWYRYLYSEAFSAMLFDRWKEALSQEKSKMPKLRSDLRSILIEPGAAININDVTRAFGGDKISVDPLLERYCNFQEREDIPESMN